MACGQFVVSCYDVNSLVSDVVELDADGQVVVSYTNQLQSTSQQNFSRPYILAVDENNECILVADYLNSRIVLLSRSLIRQACEFNVMSVDGGLQYPRCLHFNESQGRLFVGKDIGCVLVFDIVINNANSFSKLS